MSLDSNGLRYTKINSLKAYGGYTMKGEFSVKIVGNVKTPEVKKMLTGVPQNAYRVYCGAKKEYGKAASEKWGLLAEEDKKEYIEIAEKQKAMSKEAKNLAIKRNSMLIAIAEVEQEIKAIKEKFDKCRIVTVPERKKYASKGKAAFDEFKAEWGAKNLKPEEALDSKINEVVQAWKSLEKDKKAVYYNKIN